MILVYYDLRFEIAYNNLFILLPNCMVDTISQYELYYTIDDTIYFFNV